MHPAETEGVAPPLWAAILPVFCLVALLALSIHLFGADAVDGANQIALMASAAVAAVVALHLGYSWQTIEQAIVHSISITLGAILILLVVGALIGTWILGGVVPTLIYYGLSIAHPAYFYGAACVVCAFVSLSIGSSWTTAGTVGVAFIGIAQGLDLSPAIAAGAVISGSYFGDKMSPLSDTTNLAAAVTQADLFAHIRNMIWTTGPSIALALALFFMIGIGSVPDTPDISAIQRTLSGEFRIGWPMLLPLAAVLGLAAARIPALPTLVIGAVIGAAFALLFQPEAVARYGARLGGGEHMIKAVWVAFFDGYTAATGHPQVDDLLSRGGMSSMLTTVWLIMSAMTFGGVMERAGLLSRLLAVVVSRLRRTGSLILTTVLACVGVNLAAADQYMSVVIPARILAPVYARFGLAPTALSRTLEDSGTLTSPLVPWNTCGAFMAGTLGVATLDYLPFAFFNLINPLIAVLFGYLGVRVARLAPPAMQTV